MNEQYIEMIKNIGINTDKVHCVVETGSHEGNGAAAFSTMFERVISLEINEDLVALCKRTHLKPTIEFIHGDSAKILDRVLETVSTRYVLFLDAHGSGGNTSFSEEIGRYGSAALQELARAAHNPPEYILVNDMKDFEEHSTYPSVQEIKEAVTCIGDYTYSEYFSPRMYKGVMVFKRNK